MLYLFLQLLMPAPAYSNDLQVNFNNISSASGDLYIAVYNRQEDFMDPQRVCARKIHPVRQAGSMQISLGTLPPGEYAISCFHDLNGNGILDTNTFGIPMEPYGFSNNAMPKFRAPYWSEAAFRFAGGGTIEVRLNTW